MMGRYGHMGMLRIAKKRDRQIVTDALERVDMVDFRHRQIGELSGGQKKRVFLARAIAQQGDVILLDEPFTGVDVKTEAKIISLLRELRAEGKTMLVSTHNLGSVTTFCDYTVMVKGTVLASGPTDTTFTAENTELALAAYCAMSHLTARKKALLLTMNALLWHIDRQRCRGRKMNVLLEPFSYEYMLNAMWVSAMVGGLCAFLSCYLMLKGWSLIGDALSHSIVPGVAGAYMLGLPFSLGAFFSGGLAAGSMLFLNQLTRLKEDAIIGLIFSSFFGLGLFMVSLNPTSVNIQTIVLGNILAIDPADILQLTIIGILSIIVLFFKWKDLMVTFFDENHARAIGLHPGRLKILFFTLLSVSTVAALQTVGAFLVICLVVTPGATAWLLTDRFPRLLMIAVTIGSVTSFLGAWVSYFLDGATGGIIVVAQTLLFLLAFVFAPTHGLLANRRRAHKALEDRS
ncbi:hypothetical protein ECZU42_50880 [Escherichia coli]|nr:hypothetical protein ECZU42_50880 [Escherichia coli]